MPPPLQQTNGEPSNTAIPLEQLRHFCKNGKSPRSKTLVPKDTSSINSDRRIPLQCHLTFGEPSKTAIPAIRPPWRERRKSAQITTMDRDHSSMNAQPSYSRGSRTPSSSIRSQSLPSYEETVPGPLFANFQSANGTIKQPAPDNAQAEAQQPVRHRRRRRGRQCLRFMRAHFPIGSVVALCIVIGLVCFVVALSISIEEVETAE